MTSPLIAKPGLTDIVRSLVARPAQWRTDMRTLKRRDSVILASVAYQAAVVEALRFTVAVYP